MSNKMKHVIKGIVRDHRISVIIKRLPRILIYFILGIQPQS